MKKTKIIATLGPASNSKEVVANMIKAGANVFRLNFSHGTFEERQDQIKWIREAASELGVSVGILQDLQGPKIRLGDFDGEIQINEGEEIRLQMGANYSESGIIPLQYDIYPRVAEGQRLFIFDGKVKTKIVKKVDGIIYALPENSGKVTKRKGLNLPDTDFTGEVITEKDIADVEFGASADIDYVALSFVNSASDIEDLRQRLNNLDSSAKIVAKIETVAALNDIENIVKASDAVMVARGDMAVEVGAEVVPVEQRRIVKVCRKHATPVIIATQMLASMVESSEPTRAEVSDVATAVIIGSDTVMLSDETANGNYPLQAVEMMAKVAKYAEDKSEIETSFINDVETGSLQASICSAAIRIAKDIEAGAIAVATQTGASAFHIAARRPNIPIFGLTASQRVANQLALVRNVTPVLIQSDTNVAEFIKTSDLFKNSGQVVAVSGEVSQVAGTTDTIKVIKIA